MRKTRENDDNHQTLGFSNFLRLFLQLSDGGIFLFDFTMSHEYDFSIYTLFAVICKFYH